MNLLLCTILMFLIANQRWASGVNVTLTVLKSAVEKSPPPVILKQRKVRSAEMTDKTNQEYYERHSDVFDGTALRWVNFQGYVPSGAVFFSNSRAKRTEYPCSEPGCVAGFYSPSRGPYCFYPYGKQEYKQSRFWLLINENNLELLNWQKDSYGKVPANSINTCPGVRLYVAKNKYGIGKVDSLNKAFFIGINGKEKWYKSYEVLTINKGYRDQRIYNVRYMNETGTYKTEDLTLHTSEVTNNNCQAAKKTSTLSRTVTSEHHWDFSNSLSVGWGAKMTAGIPGFLGTEWRVSAERTFSWSEGTTKSESITYSQTVEVDVPAQHQCEVVMTGRRMSAEIPFTATITRDYHDGARRTTTTQGVSRNTVVAGVHSRVKLCRPIANPSPCE